MITPKRLTFCGIALLVLSWFIHIHTMMVPGLIDRAGRFKGTDYIQFYVMGSFVLEGRTDALYDPEAHLEQGRRRIAPALDLYAPYPNYGPQVALAVAPLALLPFEWSLTLFLSLSAVCYAASVWLVWRECEGLRDHGRLVALLAAASPLFLTLIRYAQLSAVALLLWSLGFVAMRRRRSFVAGLALGCLAYKPQLGLVLGVVLVISGQWRVAAGAAAAVIGQLLVAYLVGGVTPLVEYVRVLWTLMLNPRLVAIYPTEMHSLRGFFQLVVESPAAITACFLAALAGVFAVAGRSWSSRAPLGLKWGELVLLTVLASPHLITYDLVLLTIPLLVFADWAVQHQDHALRPAVALLLVFAYFAPFSGNLARLTSVQLSVVVMAILAWRVCSICTASVDPSLEERRSPAPFAVQAGG